MSWRDYNNVIAEARDVFGLDLAEAREWYREMRDELEHPVTLDDVYSHPDLALWAAEEYFPTYPTAPDWAIDAGVADEYEEYVEGYGDEPPPEYFDYELDDSFEGDDWVDPDEEIEITMELKYQEG